LPGFFILARFYQEFFQDIEVSLFPM